MYQKIWDAHVAHSEPGKPDLLYVDLHLIHELHPHEFDALREAGRRVRRPELTVATVDHNVPTTDRALPITDDMARAQIEAMERNSAEFGVEFHGLDSPGQGIVHVIGPEQGYSQPGMVIVCGDSHTSTHGAFGALAFGIGSSQVEHVLALQSIPQTPSPVMQVRVEGALGTRCHAQGPHPRHHRRDRHRRRDGPRDRILRLGDSRPLDGGPHDGVQHVD